MVFFVQACGEEDMHGCTVDCSNMTTGKIDVRNYGNVSKEECIEKGKAASCTAKWCSDGNNCEVVY
jgi:hypothetical protein